MMAFDYAQNVEPGNRVGLHYSHFWAFSEQASLANQRLAREDSQNRGRIREVGLTMQAAIHQNVHTG